MKRELNIAGRRIGTGHPVYIVAELSANHGGEFDRAVETVRAIKAAGADAVKVQTYTADTLTLACDNKYFRIRGGTLWDGRTLHDLYQEAAMPWDWQPKLQKISRKLGLDFFSTPFDASAVDFLEKLKVPAHKIASFEIVDIPLIQKVAATRKPLIISTGMATMAEIREVVTTARKAGARQISLLKCTSAYPAKPEEMNLRTLPDMAKRFGVPVGLSDHTMGIAAAVAAVALGACIVEKHFTLSREFKGPDSTFSLEPEEFKEMVEAIRAAKKVLGKVNYQFSAGERKSRVFRRSLFVVEDMRAGEKFTEASVRSIRPGDGLHPHHWRAVLGKRAARDVKRGTPLNWNMVR